MAAYPAIKELCLSLKEQGVPSAYFLCALLDIYAQEAREAAEKVSCSSMVGLCDDLRLSPQPLCVCRLSFVVLLSPFQARHWPTRWR